MKTIARLSTVVIVSFSSIAPSLAISQSFENSADHSLSSPSKPTLVAGFFDQIINTTNGITRTQRQQQDVLDRQRRREEAALARQQRLEQYRQRRLERQAVTKARQEQERLYFESLTPEQQKEYIAKKKAQQEAQAKMLLQIFSSGAAMSDSDSSETSTQYETIYEPVPSESQPSSTVYKDTGFYGNCHGGSFYC